MHANSQRNVVLSTGDVQQVQQDSLSDSVNRKRGEVKAESSSGRVMLIDGTSVIYRSYYKLLGKSQTIDYEDNFQTYPLEYYSGGAV